jgi:5-methylcytosine-specific restriction protein B
MRELLVILAATTTDATANAASCKALTDFRDRFPVDNLGDMDLASYAIGGGDQENFSWWLERGLEQCGRYSVGSSRGHIIYRQKSGQYYLPKNLSDFAPDVAMHKVAQWHAELVKSAAESTPETVDTLELAQSKPSRALKILYSYFPISPIALSR